MSIAKIAAIVTALTTIAIAGDVFAAEPCPIRGRVTDPIGEPIVGARVDLRGRDRAIATDAEGRFDFGAVPRDATPPVIVLTLAHRVGDTDAFIVFRDRKPIAFERPAEGCQFDIELRTGRAITTALPGEDWDDAVALFRGFTTAWQLATELGITPQVTLEIAAWHAAATADSSFWTGTASHHPDAIRTPLIAIGSDATGRDDPGAPDNREYHELGHHVLATALGALPQSRADTPHGGYWRNGRSADAWAEGFATFFAMQVAARIERRPEPHRFRIAATTIDLELDYEPWDFGGLEELAVAGLLLDLVDGKPAPSPESQGPAIAEVTTTSDAGGAAIAIVQIADASRDAPDRAMRLSLRDGSDTERFAAVIEADVWARFGDGPVRLPIALPEAIAPDTIARAAWSPMPARDDDPVQLDLAAVWTAIREFRSEQPESNGRLFDVADLHAALRAKFGGRDTDGDGLDDIDGLFVAHGLFADLDGDRERDENERIGATAHPARTIEIDGEAVSWPAQPQRRRVPWPAGMRARVQADGSVTPRWFLQTRWPTGDRDDRLTIATPDRDDTIAIAAPPSRDNASIVLIADAAQHLPMIAARWDARTLHGLADTSTTPTLHAAAVLSRGDPGQGLAGTRVDPRLLLWAGLGSAAIGLVLLGAGALRGALAR